MPPSSADESRVLEELRTRHRSFDAARSSAATSKDVVAVTNAVRRQRNEGIIVRDDLPRLMQLERALLEVAKDLFGPLPPDYATLVATVSPKDLKPIASKTAKSFELYERQIIFPSFKEMIHRLEEATRVFRALRPRLAPILDAAKLRVGEPGQACLYYSGCTISSSVEGRAAKEFKISGSLISNVLALWKVQKVNVYRICLPAVAINPYEFRATRQYQLEEHALISLRYPINLNSAPGGFAHDDRLDFYDPCLLPQHPRQPVPDTLVEAVRRHFAGMYDCYAGQPESPGRIHPDTLDSQVRAATPVFTLKGRVPMVALSKDITEEAFNAEHAELSYRERLTGPGPQATHCFTSMESIRTRPRPRTASMCFPPSTTFSPSSPSTSGGGVCGS